MKSIKHLTVWKVVSTMVLTPVCATVVLTPLWSPTVRMLKLQINQLYNLSRAVTAPMYVKNIVDLASPVNKKALWTKYCSEASRLYEQDPLRGLSSHTSQEIIRRCMIQIRTLNTEKDLKGIKTLARQPVSGHCRIIETTLN